MRSHPGCARRSHLFLAVLSRRKRPVISGPTSGPTPLITVDEFLALTPSVIAPMRPPTTGPLTTEVSFKI